MQLQVTLFLKMNKTKYRTVIELFTTKNVLLPIEIHSEIIRVLKIAVPIKVKICKRELEFKHGRTGIKRDPLSGCPKFATTPDITKSSYTVFEDRRLRADYIAEITGISHYGVDYITAEELGV